MRERYSRSFADLPRQAAGQAVGIDLLPVGGTLAALKGPQPPSRPAAPALDVD
jgi:hypothetical protein